MIRLWIGTRIVVEDKFDKDLVDLRQTKAKEKGLKSRRLSEICNWFIRHRAAKTLANPIAHVVCGWYLHIFKTLLAVFDIY